MLFLTKEELIELTGKRVRKAQAAALNAMKIQHKIRGDGTPVVYRSHIDREFGGSIIGPNPEPEFRLNLKDL